MNSDQKPRGVRHDAHFGTHAHAWNTTGLIRLRVVPDGSLGRVTGVSMVGVFGGMVVGAPISGLPTSEFGSTAPFWFGVIGLALLVAYLWRQFGHIAQSGDVARAS